MTRTAQDLEARYFAARVNGDDDGADEVRAYAFLNSVFVDFGATEKRATEFVAQREANREAAQARLDAFLGA